MTHAHLTPDADALRRLEALLFASPEPIATRALHDRFGEGVDVGALLLALAERYRDAGVELVERDGRWAFRTASDVADALADLREEEKKLSRAAMEMLAIIAYHQPVTRAEIENIRGVATGKGTLDVLMEMGWIKPGKRRDVPGRPLTYMTTPAFLDHFGLSALTDLPGLDDLKAAGLLDRRPAIDTIRLPSLFGDDDADGEGAGQRPAPDDGDDDPLDLAGRADDRHEPDDDDDESDEDDHDDVDLDEDDDEYDDEDDSDDDDMDDDEDEDDRP